MVSIKHPSSLDLAIILRKSQPLSAVLSQLEAKTIEVVSFACKLTRRCSLSSSIIEVGCFIGGNVPFSGSNQLADCDALAIGLVAGEQTNKAD